MSWWGIAAILGGIVLLWVLKNNFSTHGRFWRLVGRNPDLALKLFRIERACAVDTIPTNKSEYVGPFRFMDTSGQKHTVYILNKSIEAVQARIGTDLSRLAG